jgi:hypothetical protein
MSRAATLPYPGDQIIDATMARALHADACRDHAIVVWVVLWDLPAYPGRYAARGGGNLVRGVAVNHQPLCPSRCLIPLLVTGTRHSADAGKRKRGEEPRFQGTGNIIAYGCVSHHIW